MIAAQCAGVLGRANHRTTGALLAKLAKSLAAVPE
jgi:hypothetical protein